MGTALAELTLPREISKEARRLFLATGVIASNFPDLDILYTGVSPPPLGYLLHHRGHTHTVVGLIAQALLIALVCFAPPLRRAIRAAGSPRFWALVAVSLAGHLVLDSWNTYGVHPFWPLDSRWYYGDAIFIFEPWLWLFLGVAAAFNARRRGFGRARFPPRRGRRVRLSRARCSSRACSAWPALRAAGPALCSAPSARSSRSW